jgi:hypothetical protein
MGAAFRYLENYVIVIVIMTRSSEFESVNAIPLNHPAIAESIAEDVVQRGGGYLALQFNTNFIFQRSARKI